MSIIKKLAVLLLLCLPLIQINSQVVPYYETYEWSENPTKGFNAIAYKDKDIVALKEKTTNEFLVTEDDGFVEYSLIHNIYWLNSNDKIEEYNKLYLPTSAQKVIVKNKARVITKTGQIIELDSSKILEAKNDETQVNYKYFAFEGVEKGSFIEYYYVVKRFPSYTGTSVYLQDNYYKKNVSFDLYAPKNLIFKAKSYNGLPKLKKDSLTVAKNHWKIHLDDVQALDYENQSAYDTSLKKIIYKLDKNTDDPEKEYVSYREVTHNIQKSLYPELDKKTLTAIKGYLKSFTKVNNKKEKEVDEAFIRKIETHIKADLFITKTKKEGADGILKILETKITGETGLMQLYTAIFNLYKIQHEIVLTCPRSDVQFDKDFEVYNFLEHYLFYFPEFDLYMEPLSITSRLGFPDGELTDTYGLFIKSIDNGQFTDSAETGQVKFIKPINYDKTVYDLILNVAFDPKDLTTTKLKMDRKISGYYAMTTQPYLHLAAKDDKEEAINGIIKSISQDLKIEEKQVFNADKYDFGKKPLHITAKMSTDIFVDKAGKKFLFKLGDLIGLQQEMYQDKNRKLDIVNSFERSYTRKLIIDIPEGYEFKNLDRIAINESYSNDGVELFMFKSSYKIEKNQLIVSIKEYYNLNIIPVAIYENYRAVINSAANFNKVVLVLIKKD